MNFFKWQYTLTLFFILLTPTLASAEKRYISDTLIVSLRDSASLRGEIVSYLRSGDLLEVIEENDDGFILVQTPSGQQGWIQKKYTIDEKPKDLIIAELEGKNQSLQSRLDAVKDKTAAAKAASTELKDELAAKAKEISELQMTISSLKAAVTQAEGKYLDLKEKSKGVEEIFAERDDLQDRLKTTEQEVALLRVENAELIQTDRLLWFLAGFGVFIVGWIMGKVFRKSKRSSLTL